MHSCLKLISLVWQKAALHNITEQNQCVAGTGMKQKAGRVATATGCRTRKICNSQILTRSTAQAQDAKSLLLVVNARAGAKLELNLTSREHSTIRFVSSLSLNCN
jgi:hypothetical protein